MSAFVKGAALKEITSEVMKQLAADKSHLKHMDTLWARAEKTLSAEDKASIINAYLARAKQLVVTAKNKVVSESRGTTVLQEKQQQQQRREPDRAGKPGNGTSSGPVDSKKVDWSKTSDEQFLAGKITFKK